MNEHFKNIFDEATARLVDLKKQADEAVHRAKRDLGALVEYSESLPQQVLNKSAHVFLGELLYSEQNKYNWEGRNDAKVTVAGVTEDFQPYQPVLGGQRKLDMKPGKYRVIVVMQKVD